MKTLPAERRSPRGARLGVRLILPTLTALSALALVRCGAGGEDTPAAMREPLAPMLNGTGNGRGDAQTGGTFVMDDCVGTNCDLAALPAAADCGNGVLGDNEACDDKNNTAGDGCAANCLATEKGFSCPYAGQPCRQIAQCGDSLRAASEQCDDGNENDGDGCSAACRVELGSKCDDSQPSVCTPEECGNGLQLGAEGCDDGNTLPFDGCSSDCKREPNCTAAGCTSECGDGLVLNEECDDGNKIDGDGCSSTCQIEGGFKCEPLAACEQINGACILRVPAIFRDFSGSQPTFGDNACTALRDGALANQLNAQGRPVLSNDLAAIAGACLTDLGVVPRNPAQDATNFLEWYTDGPGRVSVASSIPLFPNGEGGYVNRYGANGAPWAYTVRNTQSQMGATLAACQATCQQRGIDGQAPLTGPQLRCADQCRAANDAVQRFTDGGLQQARQQLTQAMAANPVDPVAVATAQAAVDAATVQLGNLQTAATACNTTCAADLETRVAPCRADCHACAYPDNGFCVGGNNQTLDGSPLFFPVDDITGPTADVFPAKIPAQYGTPAGSADTGIFSGFPFESDVFQGAPSHNFYFTTEVEYWFKYTAGMRATLTFAGDDDVWVFLNGNLAVDLGGLHVPSTGYVTIDAPAGRVETHYADGRNPPVANQVDVTNRNQTPAQFGLQDGNVYKISVFHAERQRDSSSFQLTLAGFDAQPSACKADCGDGVISFGEECDDVTNNGNYGECGPGCKLGPFCGDGNIDSANGETCDSGPGGDPTCRGCRRVIVR